ncbi:MAG TPA: HD domain-containing protein [Candidatus Omnitrophota bacterium]|nr:HD domain-containing protein [Candidatus Omnitrophota bacterium]MDD5422945.1 HD domain-containing protein [Candidatus Omnitrophota bacterium]HOX09418.1 HD domain-containing protein [Candidatus Omnitrophota bacterium]
MKKSRYFEYQARMKKAYKELRKDYNEVKHSYSEMIMRLALIAELKDGSTGTHLVKVAEYCTEIARGLGLPKKDIDYLRYASPLHDVGKLIIPDSILKKKGGLTPEEREIVKKHAQIGAEVFEGSNLNLLKIAMMISLTHHERWDGTGYPQGLKGSDIPVFGRIVALADVFDALTSKRPYKRAFGFEEAVDIIKAESGTHFDPAIVKAFLKRKKIIRKIWKSKRQVGLFITEQIP